MPESQRMNYPRLKTRIDSLRYSLGDALLRNPSGAWIMKEVDWAFGPQWETAAGAQAIWGFSNSKPGKAGFSGKTRFLIKRLR
jgi:hypothetical protein